MSKKLIVIISALVMAALLVTAAFATGAFRTTPELADKPAGCSDCSGCGWNKAAKATDG